jgi:ABC-type antimicrobial peptide transport system permease subunit
VIIQQRKGNAFFTHVLFIFALLALMLAAIGIYGLVAYSVGQRTHEIGIRMAVGAQTSDISRMIVRDGLKTALIGSAIGFALALPIPKLFDAIFEGVLFGAPAMYPAVLAAILMVSLFAICIPALRAARIDPKTALRDQ